MFFFFNDTATTEIYTLSLHDALPISPVVGDRGLRPWPATCRGGRGSARGPWLGLPSRPCRGPPVPTDRKSTRLNSSHANISYAVFCLKKKKIYNPLHYTTPF